MYRHLGVGCEFRYGNCRNDTLNALGTDDVNEKQKVIQKKMTTVMLYVVIAIIVMRKILFLFELRYFIIIKIKLQCFFNIIIKNSKLA